VNPALSRRDLLLLSVLLGVGPFVPVVARADVLSDVNIVRIKICAGNKARAALQVSSKVSSAAQHVARGAAPQNALVAAGAGAVSARVLSLVNEARSRPRRCGSQTLGAGKPLKLNALLGRAALLHSQEMAKHSLMGHQGRDGSTPAQRVARAGYQWTAVGENVAAGPGTAEEVMAGWLASSGHCANIMSARFSEMGVGFVVNGQDDYGVYWTLSLAAPR
jgi:uncharacterized protein YkwD